MDVLPERPIELRKNGAISRLRAHRGNVPVLPQSKLCPHCPARFTRTTHLNRHLRTHSNERGYLCNICGVAQFTRSDLLTRHKRTCGDPNSSRNRKQSCEACVQSKIKCDLQQPCLKCKSRGRECVFPTAAKTPRTRTAQGSYGTFKRTSSSSMVSLAPASQFSLHQPSSHLVDSDSPRSHTSVTSLFDGTVQVELSSEDSYSSYHDTTNISDWTEESTSIYSSLNMGYQGNMFETLFSQILTSSGQSLAHGSIPGSPTPPPPALVQVHGDFGPLPELEQEDSPPNMFPFPTRDADGQPFLSEGENDYIACDKYMPCPMLAALRASTSSDGYHSQSPLPEIATTEELHHYMWLYRAVYLKHMPLMHASFDYSGKPRILIRAMEACGALFAEGERPRAFIREVLALARTELVAEYNRDMTNMQRRIDVAQATCALLPIGIFHEREEEQRPYAIMYHRLLVEMIRRMSVIQESATWRPAILTEICLEDLWTKWGLHEQLKRLVWDAYNLDTCMLLYLGRAPMFGTAELELRLPCEEELWRAPSSTKWLALLNQPSSYGTLEERLIGVPFQSTYAAMLSGRSMPQHIPLGHYAHFVLIHTVLIQLFTTCVPLPQDVAHGASWDVTYGRDEVSYTVQYSLHNWLQNWLASPNLPTIAPGEEEPPFFYNVLPFYWLAQVSLLAYQESLPPFRPPLVGDDRFQVFKRWLLHIRAFLKRSDQSKTLIWDELMKIRLEGAIADRIEKVQMPEDKEGLLGFIVGDAPP